MRDLDIEQTVALNVFPEYEEGKRGITDKDRIIAQKFKVPDIALGLIDFFFTDEDQDFIASLPGEEFDGAAVSPGYIADAFSRGIISEAEERSRFRLNDFYGMLDIFSISQTERYHSLSRQTRRMLDDWYFDSYVKSLDADLHVRPTADKVLTLDEMLEFIDDLPEPLYWAYCDCKSLCGDCGLPSHTCISFTAGINSYYSRGVSETITRDEAKDIIRKADDAGLVHTVSSHGICNCCDDCCYLFRAQRVRQSVGFWPESPHIVDYDADKCISCGKCITRCHFGVFEKRTEEGRTVICTDTTRCIGCALCVQTCPVNALSVADRSRTQMQIAGVRGQ